MKRKVYIPIVILLLFGFACAGAQITQKDTASWMNAIYNAQYADYKTWFVKDAQGNDVLKPNTPEAQKQILIKKKQIFTELHPLLIIYSEYARSGTVPTGTIIGDVEVKAVKLVNDLIAQGGK